MTLSSSFRVIYPLPPGNSTAFLVYGEGIMSTVQEDPTLAPWRRLGERLAGSFAARARGLLASEYAIQGREGEEIGRLRIHGAEGAELEAGDLEARIEHSAPTRYTMLSGGATILAARPMGALNTPEIWCLDRLYRGRLSLLRNTAEAGVAQDEVTVSIAGGLTNRSYEAVFDASNECSLPVAFFLLYLTVSLRSKAYLTGTS
jgi:hypothetical protein